MFEGRDDICVPPVVKEQTTERVLTMGFEPVRCYLCKLRQAWMRVVVEPCCAALCCVWMKMAVDKEEGA